MKRIFFLLVIFCTLQLNGQNITFTGTGLSSVKIENLTKDTIVTINAGDVLTLSAVTGISEIDNKVKTGMKIYPNPMTDRSTFEIYPPVEGDAIITVYEMTGKRVAQIKAYLGNSLQKFNVSGLNKGLYFINIKANTYQLSGKLVCNEKSNGKTRIEKISDDIQAVDERKSKMDSKGLEDPPSIQYSPVDILKFTGVSGTNTTIVTAKNITQDTTITFEFTACTDGDGYNYPVVNIGGQIWMAENLKTTKYQNGDLIGTTTPATLDLTGETAPKYQWAYNGDENNVAAMGRLYTFYAITDSRGVCPFGWHVPTNQEWTTLTTYLGGTSIAGGKLKETGTAHWASPNSGATNETGFTAIPGGLRTWDGYFMTFARWWSSTEVWPGVAYGRTINSSNDDINSNNLGENDGISVRCLNGIDPSLIATESQINDTLLLCYSKLHEYIEFSYLFDAVYANNVTAPSSSWNDIYSHSQSPENLKVLKLWSDAFEIIYKANLVMKSAEQVISDLSTRNQIIAQAKGIRAYLNYNLLTWFGEIPLEEGISESNNPRNTIDEVLALIKNEAQDAAQLLPVTWPAPEKFRMPQSLSNGLQARASLYTKSWSEALAPTQQIINSSMFTLSADTNNFTSANSEIYWGFEKGNNTEFNLFFTKGSYVPAIRFTESCLVAAESLYNSGNQTEAVGYINTLIIRRGGTPIITADLTKDLIFKYWRTEMAKEGSMFFTLKRFDKALSIVQGMPHKLILPVPMMFIISNPYLTQNPGY